MSENKKLTGLEGAYLQDAITDIVRTHAERVERAFDNEPTRLTDYECETIKSLIEKLETAFECTFPVQRKNLSAILRKCATGEEKNEWL